ncbi:DUF2771 family protein [Geodermatophilus sp. DF01-2]|uniref:DUF2771 family protein n=1 Tax=Geodermatophilus sp. DF01-2 TaxID=2559610 RepID=UPI001073627B|nr:DUF2771 family protein [Geodermatophilus sp. DF01_2]TFV63381.1 DUF2771 family protein [Geodermatophilus sp. DF01_2]
MRRAAVPALVLLLAGCGSGEPAGPQDIVVQAGPQRVEVAPTQSCLDGEGQRYPTTPPILEVSPDTTIRLTVPDAVAERGWSVQVFDERLEELLGEVDVEAGQAVFDEINASDVVPPAFYLVVVEDADEACEGFSGAWPVGFLRAGGGQGGTAAGTTAPAPPG